MNYTATLRKMLPPGSGSAARLWDILPAPSLDVPVPQMVDQLPDIEHFFAALSPDPEQVIEVPKILPLDVPMRAALRVTQLVEQLVEVPTTVSYSSLQRTVEAARRHSSSWWWRLLFWSSRFSSQDSVQQCRLQGKRISERTV